MAFSKLFIIYRSIGIKEDVEERRKKLQEFLNKLVTEKIQSKSFFKFFAPEYKFPFIVKHIHKRKGKFPITAVPFNSQVQGDAEDPNINFTEEATINFDTMQQQYTKNYYKQEPLPPNFEAFVVEPLSSEVKHFATKK